MGRVRRLPAGSLRAVAGGDGHYLFPELEPSDTTVPVADALARCLEGYSPVAPQVEGRIVFQPPN